MLEIRQWVKADLLLVEGIWKLIRNCRHGIEFEDCLRRLSLEVSARIYLRIYLWSLERLDERLFHERDRSPWKVAGLWNQALVTTMGKVPLRLRLYRDRESGVPVFLLDRILDYTLKKRLSLCLERMS